MAKAYGEGVLIQKKQRDLQHDLQPQNEIII